LASPEQTATAEVVPKFVAGSSFTAASSTLLPFDVQITAVYCLMNARKRRRSSTKHIDLVGAVGLSQGVLRFLMVLTGRLTVIAACTLQFVLIG
ncbi:hypothetical protein Tco_0950719, partial [Tanacetum coccineum]